jgi:hypothetical protein
MTEREMEDLIAQFPNELIPGHNLVLKGRQESFAGVGRFDLLFVDRFETNVLMELKARTAKYEDATQLAKYKEVLAQTGDRILMWLVAPLIPRPVRDFLDHIGIQYTEIHEIEFRMTADRHGVILKNSNADQSPMDHSNEGPTEPRTSKPKQPLESPIRDGRSSKEVMEECLAVLKQIHPNINLNYVTRKAQDGTHTGLLVAGKAWNFIQFNPTKTKPLVVRVKLPTIEGATQWKERLKAVGIEAIERPEKLRTNPEEERRKVRFGLSKEQFNADLLLGLFRESYEAYGQKSR